MRRHGPVTVQCTNCIVFPKIDYLTILPVTHSLFATGPICSQEQIGQYDPGQFTPCNIRFLVLLLPGQFTPWPFWSLAITFSGTFAPRSEMACNFRSKEYLLTGTFGP